MSRFFSKKYDGLAAYVPGEQPQDMQYIKLNTNESPYPPSAKTQEAIQAELGRLELYSDPENRRLKRKLARVYGVNENQVITTNGSDEVLNFAFMAFADESRPLVFADITYGFYKVLAELARIPYETIALRDDLTIDADDYIGIGCTATIVIANPNSPTGEYVEKSDIEKIVASNPDSIVIVDEAYINFGGDSSSSLVPKYDNLVVVSTFSKSYSLAGARLGFAIADSRLIADMNTIKYSCDPYAVNRMSEAAGVAALVDGEYYKKNCDEIIKTRSWTAGELKKLGFTMTDSRANFIFARHESIGGEQLYEELKKRGILIRHLSGERIKGYNRITIGTMSQMQKFVEAVSQILGGVYGGAP